MRYDVKVLVEMANQLGVVRNTLEKVLRLSKILKFINSNATLKHKLALKGGTAINLLYDNLPRLSVDIDLDYAINDTKESMLDMRKIVRETLESYFINEGYTLNKNSRFSFSVDSFVISYVPSGGGSDNIKVEINYSMRSHLLPLEVNKLNFYGIDQAFDVLTVSKIEIYAGKINALLSRSQIRDLYDTFQMLNKKLLNHDELSELKNIVIFYRYIQNDTLDYDDEMMNRHNKRSYLRDLLPVLRKGDQFNLEDAKKVVLSFLDIMTDYDENQLLFIKSINEKNPKFEHLFKDQEKVDLAKHHPMSIWKLMQ
jgi:predicted nucleotidyltransferase component of viral defense system